MRGHLSIIEVLEKKDVKNLSEMFRRYEQDLGFDLQFQNFSEELTSLEKMYGEPNGAAFLLMTDDKPVGCIAVRQLEGNIAEIKRMFIEKPWRGKGFGNSLLEKALEAAKKLGYKKARLDTLSYMQPAINSYKRFGFYEIPAYRHNPFDNAVFMEREL